MTALTEQNELARHAALRRPREYKAVELSRLLRSRGWWIHPNTIRRAMKRGDLEVTIRPNGRGGTSTRILCDPLRDCFHEHWWLSRQIVRLSKKKRRRLFRNLNHLEWGDVYRFVLDFTSYAVPIPESSGGPQWYPSRMTRNAMELIGRKSNDLMWTYDLAVLTDPRIRGGFRMDVTREDWHDPIRTESDLKEAFLWTRSLPLEEINCYSDDRIWLWLGMLRSCTAKRRRVVLQLLRARRTMVLKDIRFTKKTLAKLMVVTPSQLSYYMKTNLLMKEIMLLTAKPLGKPRHLAAVFASGGGFQISAPRNRKRQPKVITK